MSSIKTLEEEIKNLERKLAEVRLENSKTLLWDSSNTTGKHIGFHNISKCEFLLRRLYKGEKLLMEHAVYGSYIIKMNPQRNRFLVSKLVDGYFVTTDENIREDNVESYLFSAPTTWYKLG